MKKKSDNVRGDFFDSLYRPLHSNRISLCTYIHVNQCPSDQYRLAWLERKTGWCGRCIIC